MRLSKIVWILLFLFMSCLGMLSLSYSVNLTNGNQAYYTNDNTLVDATGNGYDYQSSSLPTYNSSGKINGAYSCDGNNDYLNTTYMMTGQSTISIWIYNNYADAPATNDLIFGNQNTNPITFYHLNTGNLKFRDRIGGTNYDIEFTDNYLNVGWNHIMYTIDDAANLHKVYINNIERGSNSGSFVFTTHTIGLGVCGRIGPTPDGFWDGTFDELSIWNRVLNATERQAVFENGNNSIQYPYTVSNVTTPTIQLNISSGDYFKNEPINVSLTTPTLVNMSVYYNGTLNQTINNTNSTTVLLSMNLGNNNFEFRSSDAGGVAWNNITVVYDNVSPVIQQIGNVTEGSFAVNFSEIFNVTDSISGLNSCFINVTELENVSSPDNFVLNCTETKAFTTAGLHNAFVTAFDNAGNNNTFSWNFTITPYVLIQFNASNGSLIKKYNATIYHPDGRITTQEVTNFSLILSPVNNGSLDLGVHNILFDKTGYVLQNFSVNITSSSGNETIVFNATDSVIQVTIRDQSTGTIITGENFTLSFIATVGLTTSTITGTASVSNVFFLSEQYQLVVTSTNYTTESIFFNFNNQEILPLTVYVTSKNLTGFATVKCVDVFGSAAVGALAEARQWDATSSSYITVSQAQVPESGAVNLPVILNVKQYRFRCSLGGLSSTSVERILAQSFEEIILTLSPGQTSEGFFLDTVNYVVEENFVNNISYINFSWSNTDGTDVQGCVRYLRLFSNGNRLLLNETCVVSASAEIKKVVAINSSYDILAEVGFRDSSRFYKQASFVYPSIIQFGVAVKDLNIHYYLLPLAELVGVLITMSNVFLGAVFLVIINGAGLWFVPDFMTSRAMVVVLILCLILIWAGWKRK